MKYARTVFAFACWTLLLSLPASAQQTRPAAEYAAVLLNGQKVGYSDIKYTSFSEAWVKQKPFFTAVWET